MVDDNKIADIMNRYGSNNSGNWNTNILNLFNGLRYDSFEPFYGTIVSFRSVHRMENVLNWIISTLNVNKSHKCPAMAYAKCIHSNEKKIKS